MREVYKIVSVTKYYGEGNEDYWTTDTKKASNTYLCDKINYHEPRGEGDSHYCDIYKGENFTRLFSPSKIEFEKIDEVK